MQQEDIANPAQYIVHSFLSKDHYLYVRLSVLLCVCSSVYLFER